MIKQFPEDRFYETISKTDVCKFFESSAKNR